MAKTCKDCIYNDSLLCDRCGYLINDDDPACKLYESEYGPDNISVEVKKGDSMKTIEVSIAQLNQLFECLIRMNTLTGKAGWAIIRNTKSVESEYSVAEKMRENLFKKYGEQQEDGSFVVKNNKEKFISEMQSLLDTKVTIDLYQLPREEYDQDQMYCESARAIDYKIFEEFLVEPAKDKTS